MQEFLSKLDPPIVIESDKLRAWHPEFELDNVPDVVPEPLPQPPLQQEVFTAKTVLGMKSFYEFSVRIRSFFNNVPFIEKAHDLISVNNRMRKAVEAAAEQKKEAKESEPSKPATPTSTSDPLPALHKALRNIPKSLLEKVNEVRSSFSFIFRNNVRFLAGSSQTSSKDG